MPKTPQDEAQVILLLQNKLDNHIENFDQHCADEDKRWSHLMATQEHNTESIKELISSNKDLADSTRDIISIYQAADGAIKTATVIGKFMKWLSGFAIVGAIVKWIIDHSH